MKLSLGNRFLWLTLFAIAMAYLESAVVVYLRKIYYPEGFAFPLEPIGPRIALTELFREVATIFMLIGAGMLMGQRTITRFAYFIYCFAVWDIFYYIFLKVLLGWPASFLTPDILFLIPMPWVGPVLAPVLVSLSLIVLAGVLIKGAAKSPMFRVERTEWFLLILGALVIILSFLWDYGGYVLRDHSFIDLFSLSEEELFRVGQDYVPRDFDWTIFLAGELLATLGVVSILRRYDLLGVLKKETDQE